MSEELKPCPFDGGPAWLIDYEARFGGMNPRSRCPQCASCGANLGYFPTAAKAIAAWNRRSPLVGSSLGSLAQAALVPTGGPLTTVVGWQPIESAPKDGADIVAISGNGVEIMHWHDGLGGPGWLDDSSAAQHDYWNYVGATPTHWMPLPPAPDEVAT